MNGKMGDAAAHCASLTVWILILTGVLHADQAQQECPPGTQPLFFYRHTVVHSGEFVDNFIAQLRTPLSETGYCLREIESAEIVFSDSTLADRLVMVYHEKHFVDKHMAAQTEVTVTLLKAGAFSETALTDALRHPLAGVRFGSVGDTATAGTILVDKIIENMRTSYVVLLTIMSDPSDVRVATSTGLESTSPVEWILPLDTIGLSAHKEGYLSATTTLPLQTPGRHTFHFDLVKRRFYHSRFMIGVSAFAVSALACYGLEWYFYDRYSRLGVNDFYTDPEKFDRTFTRAKWCERLGGASLVLATISLGLSFMF
jgi:hypothetical protein